MLLSSVRDGIVPDIGHIDHVRDTLQKGGYEAFDHRDGNRPICTVLIHSEWTPSVLFLCLGPTYLPEIEYLDHRPQHHCSG